MKIIWAVSIVSLLVVLTQPANAQKVVTETKAQGLEFRAIRAERTKGDLEVLVYSIKNASQVSLTVLMSSGDTWLGLCNEFSKSSVPMIPPSEALNLKGRGLVLRPGEEAIQSLVAAKSCLRELHVTRLESYFFVRYPDRQVRFLSVGLGPFTLKPPGVWP